MKHRTFDRSSGKAYFTKLTIWAPDGTEEAIMMPGLHVPGPLDPQDPADAELLDEALRFIDRLRTSRESLDRDFVQRFADRLCRDGDAVAQGVACHAIRRLMDLYEQKLKFAAAEQGTAAIARQYPHIRETPAIGGDPGLEIDATGIERAIVRIGAIVRGVIDHGNGWWHLAEWVMTQVVASTAEELEEEHGREWLGSLSAEEFNSVFLAKFFSDGNIADKGLDALHHFMQQFTDPIIEDLRGDSIPTVGRILGLPNMRPRRGRQPRTPTGYDRGTWLLLASELRQRRDEGATYPELAEWLGVEDWRTAKRWLVWYEDEPSIA